jgi:hypothetical protein
MWSICWSACIELTWNNTDQWTCYSVLQVVLWTKSTMRVPRHYARILVTSHGSTVLSRPQAIASEDSLDQRGIVISMWDTWHGPTRCMEGIFAMLGWYLYLPVTTPLLPSDSILRTRGSSFFIVSCRDWTKCSWFPRIPQFSTSWLCALWSQGHWLYFLFCT